MTVGCRTDHRARVLAAVKQGVSDPKAIATWSGVEPDRVRTEIKRLQDSGEIRRCNRGGYEAVTKKCLLADVWK